MDYESIAMGMVQARKLRVLFWPGWWYPDRFNPANGIFIRRHAEAVAPLVDLAVLYVTADPGLAGHAYEIEIGADEPLTVRVYYRPFPVPWRPLRILNACRYFCAARRGIRELHSRWGRPEIVHLHVSPPWGQIAALKVFYPHRPFLFTEHWSGYQKASGSYRGFFRKRINSWVMKNAAAVTTVSRALQGTMEEHGLRGRFTVIPNSVDTDIFFPAVPPTHSGPFTFLHVSRLVPLKNVSGILRTTAALRQKRQDFRLIIVGDGTDRSSLQELAATLSLDDECVRFMGRQGQEELAETMRQSDCFVLFSNYENLPCVIAEAQTSGLPVIATRVGGVPEQVRPGMGILLEPGDEAGLKDAMTDVLDGRVKFDRDAIRRFAVERYGFPTVGANIVDLYRQALDQARRSS